MARIDEPTYEGGAEAASVRALLQVARDVISVPVRDAAGAPLEARRTATALPERL